MTKQEAFALLKCNGRELADLLGIEPSAVYQWSSKCIPLAREYQIRDIVAGKTPLSKSDSTKSQPLN